MQIAKSPIALILMFVIFPALYETGALFFKIPDYFSWLVWYLFFIPVLLFSISMIIKNRKRPFTLALSFFILIGYLPYIIWLNNTKTFLFFKKNQIVFTDYITGTKTRERLELIGVQDVMHVNGNTYFLMDTDSDWCWGYSYITNEIETNSICSNRELKLKHIDGKWYVF